MKLEGVILAAEVLLVIEVIHTPDPAQFTVHSSIAFSNPLNLVHPSFVLLTLEMHL